VSATRVTWLLFPPLSSSSPAVTALLLSIRVIRTTTLVEVLGYVGPDVVPQPNVWCQAGLPPVRPAVDDVGDVGVDDPAVADEGDPLRRVGGGNAVDTVDHPGLEAGDVVGDLPPTGVPPRSAVFR